MGASGLPKMDLLGSADPYFVAKLDDEISFVFVPLVLLVMSWILTGVFNAAQP